VIALVVGFIGALIANAASAPDGPFLCLVDRATGFAFDKQSKSWKQANFEAGEKYVLKRVKKSSLSETEQKTAGRPDPAWGVWEFGFPYGEAWCSQDVDEYGALWCKGEIELFNVNLRSHRFVRAYTGLYAQDPSQFPDEHADAPVVEIGKCTEL